jgi:hypothetical protein
VWDASTKFAYDIIVLNEHTPTDDEAPITFGITKMQFYIWVYNMRISFPDTVILAAMADVKACFRFPRIHPDLTGAFGFLADAFYCLATAMVQLRVGSLSIEQLKRWRQCTFRKRVWFRNIRNTWIC